MIMRDVMDGLEELATESSLGTGPRGCQILSIEPPARNRKSRQPQGHRGAIVDFFRYKKAV
jgi:hypothetical protein